MHKKDDKAKKKGKDQKPTECNIPPSIPKGIEANTKFDKRFRKTGTANRMNRFFLAPRLKKSCLTQLSRTFFLLIDVKMPTIVGILTFMSRKNSIIGLSEQEKAESLLILILMSI